MNAELPGMTSLLDALSVQLKIVHKYERLLDYSLARRFNPLNYLGRDENAVTEVLRDLLDPNGTHGQDTAFLARYLELLDIQAPTEKMRNARVRTQTSTEYGRRLDLTIEIPGVVYVGLENKIDAFEQETQIPDYADFIVRKSASSWRLIFLTPSGYQPDKIDPLRRQELLDSGNLVCHSYREHVSEWLWRCAGDCTAEKVRSFLKDLADWAQTLEVEDEMDLGKATLIKDFVSRDAAYVSAALAIMDNEKSLRALLIAPLMEDVTSRLRNELPQDDWRYGRENGSRDLIADLKKGNVKTNAGIFVNQPTWPTGCSVGIALQEAGDLIYGMFWPEWRNIDRSRAERISTKLSSLQGKARSSDVWPWYRPIPGMGAITAHNPRKGQMIHAIYDGRREELVNYYVALIKSVAESVATVSSLDE